MFPCFYCPFDSIYKCSNSHSSWFLYKPARPVEKIFITSYVLWYFPVVYSLIQLIYNSVKAYWHFVHCWFIRFESAAFRQARCDEHQERELCASCPRCKKKVMSQVKMINSTFYLVPYGDSKAFVQFSSYFFLSAWRPKKKINENMWPQCKLNASDVLWRMQKKGEGKVKIWYIDGVGDYLEKHVHRKRQETVHRYQCPIPRDVTLLYDNLWKPIPK
mgnify:CR=1 FL=1